MPEQFDLIATTAFGLEAVVVRELENLGYDAKGSSTGRVHFTGDASAIARSNLWLRAADRVLLRVGQFEAADFGVLFDAVKALPWERWIARESAFPVNGRSVRSQLSSVPACQRIVKKAIVERLRESHGVEMLPENGPPVTIEVALLDNVATLTIDTSGVGLHKRGYRPMVGEAALKETLAAGLVLLSVWRPGRVLMDPFCGTGTLAIEAAMIGRNIAPGLRRRFEVEGWTTVAREWAATWQRARQEAQDSIGPALSPAIIASDVDAGALAHAEHAAGLARVDKDIRFTKVDFGDIRSDVPYGCIITNPPYGVRLGDDDGIERLYHTMPLVLRRFPTWSFHILTARQDLEYLVGQRATRRRKLFNSQIECTYFTFLGPRPPRASQQGDAARTEQSDAAPMTDQEPDGVEDRPVRDDDGVPAREEATSAAFGGLRSRDMSELEQFRKCLANNVRHLRRWPSRGVTCYRLYDRDVPDAPLIIDRYEHAVHVAEYERVHSRTMAQHADWLDRAKAIIAECTGVPQADVHIKAKHRQRGLTQHERQDETGATIVANEAGLRFEVNLSDYIDTGLFLDHRNTRGMVRDAAAGKRFLNLFCYTGSFSVYAAAGGAAATTSVDLSNTYLEWTNRNLALNGMTGAGQAQKHRLLRSDVLEFLRTHPQGGHYDLAVMDPPTFSNSKSTEEDWEVAVGHSEALRLLLSVMAPGGIVFFSNNYRRFKLDEEMLHTVGATWQEISRRTVPEDYRNKRIHRCWRIIAP